MASVVYDESSREVVPEVTVDKGRESAAVPFDQESAEYRKSDRH